MTTFFYFGAMVCLVIIVLAFKKPEALSSLEKIHKNFEGMTKAKAVLIFIPAFLVFIILGGAFSEKKPEKPDSESTNKEVKTEEKQAETETNLTKFKKEIQAKNYYAAYHLLAKLSDTEKKSLLGADMNEVKVEYGKLQKELKEKYKIELEAITTETKKKNNTEAITLCKKLIESEPQFDEPTKLLSDLLKQAYKIDIAQINQLHAKGSYQEAIGLADQILTKEPKFQEVLILKEKANTMLSYFAMTNRELKEKLEMKSCVCNRFVKRDNTNFGNKSLNKAFGEINSLVESRLNCKITIFNPTPVSFKPETDVVVKFLSSTDAEIKVYAIEVKENLKPFKSISWTESDILDPREDDEIKRTAKTLCVIDDVTKEVQ